MAVYCVLKTLISLVLIVTGDLAKNRLSLFTGTDTYDSSLATSEVFVGYFGVLRLSVRFGCR